MVLEIWKEISDYENLYQVSNLGNIKSLARKVKRGNHYLPVKEKLLKGLLDDVGYYNVKFSKKGVVKSIRIHIIVASAFIPNPDNKPCINHKNGDKIDNRVENLEWVTYSENIQHAINKLGAKIGIRSKEPEVKEKIRKGVIMYNKNKSSK